MDKYIFYVFMFTHKHIFSLNITDVLYKSIYIPLICISVPNPNSKLPKQQEVTSQN